MKRILLALALALSFAGTAPAQILLKQSTATTRNFKLTSATTLADDTTATITGLSISIIKQSDTTSSTATTVSAAASGSANDCVHVAKGIYNCELSAANTDTLGALDVCVANTGDVTDCIRFMVVAAASWAVNVDGNIASTATLQADLDDLQARVPATLTANGNMKADTLRINGTAQSAGDATAGIATTLTTLGTPVADIAADIASLKFVADNVSAGQIIRRGVAQSGAASSITLDTGASAINGFYSGALVLILSGTGAGQARLASGYVGATKILNVSRAWVTTPDATSVFAIEPSSDPLQSTVAARQLDVNATGGAGVDLDNTDGTVDAAELGADVITAAKLAPDVRTELIGTPAGASVSADVAAVKAQTATIQTDVDDLQTRLPYVARKATSFRWPLEFTSVKDGITPIGAGVTPVCTRTTDAPNSFVSTTNSPSATSSLGISELVISVADMTGDNYMFLSCTATGALRYRTIFKIQSP